VEACEKFEANVDINFRRAAKPSSLHFVPKSIPDCGFDLVGDIDVHACETITAETNITTCNATKGSNLILRTGGPDNESGACSIILEGSICAEACESFTASSSINIVGPTSSTGKKMVTRDEWTFEPSSIPDCGVKLFGDVELMACVDFKVDGQFSFNGPHWKSDTLTITANGSPDCGLVLEGALEIEACKDFNFSNKATIKGNKSGIVSGSWEMKPSAQPNCGLDIVGDIIISACNQMDIETEAGTGGVITITGSKGVIGAIDLSPTLTITNGVDDCSKKISIQLGNGTINIPDSVVNVSSSVTGGGGKCYDCGRVAGCETHMSLNRLETYVIVPPPAPCCSSGLDNYIDMCAGSMKMGGKLEISTINIGTNKLTEDSWEFGNISFSDCSMIVGDRVNVHCDFISIDNVKLTSDTIQVGNTFLTDGSLNMGTTQISDGNVSVGDNTYMTDGNVGVGGVTISADKITVGETTSISDIITVGKTTSIGDIITVGTVDITDGMVSVGALDRGDLNGERTQLVTSGLNISDNLGGNVRLDIPKDSQGNSLTASWQQIKLCEDGVTKVAWVLMTAPQAV
jgi:hypothetical protein